MLDLFDVFPFNVPAGIEFLIYYVGFSGLVLLWTWWIRDLVGDRLERSRLVAAVPPGGSYRSDAKTETLMVGEIPRLEDAPALAYLFGGVDRVADLLVSTALAQGWLAADLTVNAAPRDNGPQQALHARVNVVGEKLDFQQIIDAAKEVAVRMEPGLRAILERSGLLRTQETQRTMRRIVLSVGGLLVAIACVRIVVRAAISGSAPFPAYLMIAICGVVGITIWMSVGNDVSSATCGYRVWLESATHSLRADVSSYRRRHIDDIAVAVAIGGVVVLMYHPEMAAYAAHMQAQAAANTSSSTCSSSCGGGGGGCGGGCGGGGGCS